MRHTGIDVIGDVQWGTHFCQFYESAQDLVETLVPYFKEGLAANEFCMWVTSEPLGVQQAREALKEAVPNLEGYIHSGQIEIIDYKDWYVRLGKFSADEVLKGWVDKLTAALDKGFEGLRLSGNTFWLEKAVWEDFRRYEEAVNDVIGQHKMLAMCTYSLERCGATEILDVVANHKFALIKRQGRWEIIQSTAQKQIEERLKKSELTHSTILSTARSGFWLADMGGKLLEVNQAYCRMSGYSQGELLKMSVCDLEGSETPEDTLKHIQFVRRHGHHQFETLHRRKDGTAYDVEVRTSYLDIEGGRLVVFVWDISDRKKMERELRESEEQFRTMADGSPDIIWVTDTTGAVRFINRKFHEFFGITQKQVEKTNWQALIHPDDAEVFLGALNRSIEERMPFTGEARVKRFDGQSRLLSSQAEPRFSPEGEFLGYVGRSLDISDRRQAEEEVKWLASFPVLNPMPVVEVDVAGRVCFSNPAAQNMFPDLLQLGKDHPWLAGWSSLAEAMLRPEGNLPPRDILVGEKWFHQTMYFVPETRRLRTYGDDISLLKSAEEELRQHACELEKARAQAENEKLRLEAVMEALPVGVAITDVRGGKIKANSTYDRIWAGPQPCVRSVSDYAAYKAWWADTGRPLAPEEWASAQVVEKSVPIVGQMIEIERFDGSRAHVINSASPVRDAAGHVVGSAVAIQDITELRRSQDDLRRLNRTLTALSHSNQALMHARDEKEFLEEACQIIVRDCGHAMVWIGFAEKDPQKSVKPVAFAGFEDGYIETLNMSWADTERGRGPTGTAIRTGKPCACSDMLTDPKFAPWREQAIARGYASSLVLPLFSESTPMGAISIYFRQPGRVSEDEMDLLSELANDIAYGIASIRLREAHARAEQSLQQRSRELQKLTETLEQRVADRTAELATANELLKAEITQRHILTAAVGQVQEGMVITDAGGRIEYLNPAFEKTNRVGRARLLGKRYYDLLVAEGADQSLGKQAQKTVEGGKAWSAHLVRKQKDAQASELDIKITPIRDRSGKIINYLVTERDVTQEVRLQQHLRQAQKMEALGTLAGGIAHDFNNILNPIFINTELVLMDAPLDQAARRELETVLKAAERGRDLVKQIITFSRQKEKERTPLKVGPVIKEALKFLRSSLPATIEMRQRIEPESGFILADPSQIHQVVMNLCNNAAYAMQEKGGTLDVSLNETAVDKSMALLHPGLKPGPYLRLTVCDTGKGMTPEVMERAFDPFFTTKKHGEGSGMGLALVHGIVGDYGGAVTVYSEVDKGTTFNIFFPRVATAEFPAEAEQQEPLRGTERILLVDDERTQAQSIRNMLKRLGYQVAVRTDSEQALAAFRKDPDRFDLVITDQIMPKLTGVQLATRLLKLRPGLPVILCTGFSEQVDSEGARALGIRGFLMKPFSIREMADAIKKALS